MKVIKSNFLYYGFWVMLIGLIIFMFGSLIWLTRSQIQKDPWGFIIAMSMLVLYCCAGIFRNAIITPKK